jgi:valyl-tRNA synthetase
MDNYGADALRFWAAGSKLGNDLDYQEKDLITGKKFLNKLTNASKFVFMNLEDYKNQKPKKLQPIDKLFLKKLDILIKSATYRFETYEYSKAKIDTEKFFWNMFADNYMEIIKKRIYNQTGDKKISAQYTLYKSLLTILKLIAPIMPFITEEIYQTYFKKTEKEKSIHISEWPISEDLEKDKYNETLDLFIKILGSVRQEKTKKQKSMKSEIILTISEKDYKTLKEIIKDLKDVTNAKEIKQGKFKVEFVE